MNKLLILEALQNMNIFIVIWNPFAKDQMKTAVHQVIHAMIWIWIMKSKQKIMYFHARK